MREIIFSSSVLIAALLILRKVFEKSIPRRLQYGLWALVLIRLLVPVTFPGLSFDTFPFTENTDNITERQIYVLPIDSRPTSDFPKAEQALPGEPVASAESFGYNVLSRDGTRVIKYADIMTLSEVLTLVWTAGMAAMLIWTVFSNLRFWQRLKKTRKPYDVPGCKYRVYIAEGLSSPCLFGRTIYLTEEAVSSPETLRHVLVHEEIHGRHFDQIWSLLRSVCLIIYWFNPFVWAAAAASRTDCELACDEGALRVLDSEERIAYGRTLLSLIHVKRTTPQFFLSAATMSLSKRQLEKRIRSIAEKRYSKVFVCVAAVALAAVICVLTFTGNAERKPMTGEELKYFNEEFFNGSYMNIRNQFLSSVYESAEDINLLELFYCGTGKEAVMTDEEKAALEAAGWELFLDVTKLPKEDINEVLIKYTGTELERTNKIGLDSFVYLSEYDTYYIMHGDTNYRMGVDISCGEKQGKYVYLYYNDLFMGDGWKCVTLKKSGSEYLFVSNVNTEKPQIATVYPKNPVEKVPVQRAEAGYKEAALERHTRDCAERLGGYSEGDNLIRVYRSTDGNVYAAVIYDDSPEDWDAGCFLTLPENDYEVNYFWELFGYGGLIISYGDNTEGGRCYDYYTFSENGVPLLLAEVYTEKGKEPKIIDLDGNGENELASGGKIFFQSDGIIYETDVNEALSERYSLNLGEWDKDYRSLDVSGIDEKTGKSFEGYVFFDGKNILLYKKG